ncbi:MAG: sulfotransferase [Alphaproteobacteria bacterium]|nr:sulfotransferase [Alphaproteobacteria bacterium]MDP6832704.1 sulfotransferase [Alphaproteobacteria bacterium]MDP6875658.1 sulfotransferase [Alphaproteobacteria bacterium]
MTMKVIGAGFGRTGTLSMKGALEHLGLGPCYHMLEVLNRPENADAWFDAAQGEPLGAGADWDDILRGYQSSVDWPACHFWRPLSEHYPDAKVILTVRDEEAWWNSISNTIFRSFQTKDSVNDPDRLRMRRMSRDLIVNKVFGGNLTDREHALAVYRRNIETVEAALPKERLLVFDVAQGWEPLCAFLELPVPDDPFPSTNTTKQFQERMAARNAGKPLPPLNP